LSNFWTHFGAGAEGGGCIENFDCTAKQFFEYVKKFR
jgi:hypothetical protein